MSLARRLELCAEAGIELAIVEPFTREFAATPADAFVRDVLGRDLGARDVVVGYDFSFGRGRAGDAGTAGAAGAEPGHRRRRHPADRDRRHHAARRRAFVSWSPPATPSARRGCWAVRSSSRGRWCAARAAAEALGFPDRQHRRRGRASPGAGHLRGPRARAGRSAGGPGPRRRRSASAATRRSPPRAATSASKRTCWISKVIFTIGGCASRSASDCATS